MRNRDWSREEVEATVLDYFSMLSSWLAGTPFNKTAHRRALIAQLDRRTDDAIEYKYRNISAVLVDASFPYLPGLTPLFNYQALLAEVVADRLPKATGLLHVAEAAADAPIVVPEVDDILAVLTKPPKPSPPDARAAESRHPVRLPTNYVEREALNRSLGLAGELFVLNFERARLIHAGREGLANKVVHTSVELGDHEGFDILSYEETGAERLIEVKTTKYGSETPFFVTRNELHVSSTRQAHFQLYRLFEFKSAPRLFTLLGSIESTCRLSAATFVARPR